jgi:hypothetical protein
MKSIAIYLNEQIQNNQLQNIKNYYLEKDYADQIFTCGYENKNVDLTQFANIATYNLNFFDGIILFLKVEDLEDHSYIKCHKHLLVEKKDLPKIDKKHMQDVSIFILDKNKIRGAKNAELQSVFR